MAALGVCVGVFFIANRIISRVSDNPAPVEVDIPLGANLNTIAHRLKEAHLIHSEIAFKGLARLLYGGSKEMKAGRYKIPQNLGNIGIIELLLRGEAESQWVVIPEGKTIAQVADILDQHRLASANKFGRAAHRSPKAFGFAFPIPRRSLEGYLMPDSYNVSAQMNGRERELVQMMVKDWKTKVWAPNQGLFRRSGLPPDKVIIIASMIEAEARVPQDREKIASVIYNRLEKKMKLQIDATVLYALRHHKNVVSLADLKVESPYNTYRVPGLPAGPICSPGLASVLAALRPARTNYLYYVAQSDGSHIFSSTAAEHQAAVQHVRALKGATAKAQ